jgi:hypothetical protein
MNEVKLVEIKIELDTVIVNKNEIKKRMTSLLKECGATNVLIYLTYKEKSKPEKK